MSKQRSKLWLPDDRIVEPPLRSMGAVRRQIGGIGGRGSSGLNDCCKGLAFCCSEGPCDNAPESIVVDIRTANYGCSANYGILLGGPYTLDRAGFGSLLRYRQPAYPALLEILLEIACGQVGGLTYAQMRIFIFGYSTDMSWGRQMMYQKQTTPTASIAGNNCLTELFGDEWEDLVTLPYLSHTGSYCYPTPSSGYVDVWFP